MPRSSRHKSSKHNSRDVKDYSDSEKDSSLKERRVKEETSVRALKESPSGDKRKADLKDSKDLRGSENGEYLEVYTSKRRKERADDGASDRWNGGENERGESSKKSKALSDSRSGKKDEGEGEEVKKSSGKSEGKHKESSRKEGREAVVERDRERKYKEGRIERLLDDEEHRILKQASEKTEFNSQDPLCSHESENHLERRVRKKRDEPGDVDKHQDDIGDINDRRMPSREDISKDGRLKDEKHKNERYKDKYREDADRETKLRDDKQCDKQPTRDHVSSRADEKRLRTEKDNIEVRLKKSKLLGSDHNRDRELDHERERDLNHDRDHDRNREREHDRGRDKERERNKDRGRRARDRDRDLYRDRDWDLDRDRDRDRERKRDYDHDRDVDKDRDRDESYLDERSARYKDSRSRKSSPDDRGDLSDPKSRGIRTHYLDADTRTSSGIKAEPEVERGRSQSRQSYVDTTGGSNRPRASPSASSHGADEFRHMTEQRPKTASLRDASGFSAVSERGSKYRSTDKSTKMDEGHLIESLAERSSVSKASPMGLVEISPTSTGFERKHMNRASVRPSLGVEETGRRTSASVGSREPSATEERSTGDLPPEKPLFDEPSQADLSYNRASQSNSFLIHPSPVFRPRVGSPSLKSSLDEDCRANIGSRYKRSGDPNAGRGQGNPWRGTPNWSSPLPNGFIPFPHGPPHGGFPAMMTQYPSPSLFGVRPSMEMNHSGISYHMPDAERFSSYMRPLGWQNMMDSSGPSHLHGWDGSNSVFRDETHMYGGHEWDRNRHHMNGRVWEPSTDMWKAQNGDANADLSLKSKEDYREKAPDDDTSVGQVGQCDNNHVGVGARSVERKLDVSSPSKEPLSKSSPTINVEKKSETSNPRTDDNVVSYSHIYISRLDISAELAGQEVHSQCMSLLETEPCATIDEEITMLLDLKDGGRAVSKSYITLFSSLPSTNDSVFQRAIDLYKKQRIEFCGFPIVDKGRFDVLLEHNKKNTDLEQGNIFAGKEEEKFLIPGAENTKEQIPFLFEEKKEENVSASSPNLNTPKDLEMLGEDLISQKTELKLVSSGDKMVDLDIASPENTVHLDIASLDGTTLPADGHNLKETSNGKEDHISHCSDEGNAFFDDAFSGNLVLTDAFPKVSGTLILDSNHSESVLLSRIHHSPKSTH